MKDDCARQQGGLGTKEQRGEDVAEKRLRLFAQEVMPALEELSPQPLQAATSMGKHCVQAICHKEEGMSTTNEQIVVEFFSAFDRLDLEGALSYLTRIVSMMISRWGFTEGKKRSAGFLPLR